MTQRLTGIDGIRGFFCLVIVFLHVVASIFTNADLQMERTLGRFLVQLFFLCSGFLIFKSFSQRSLVERFSKSNFFIRRSLRIFPLWWVTLLVFYGLKPAPLEVLLANMTYVFGFRMYDKSWVMLDHGWSLFVEEIFYLFFPFMFKWISSRNILAFIFGSLLLSLYWYGVAGHFQFPSDNHFIHRFPLPNLKYFFIGIGFYFLMQNEHVWNKLLSSLRPWIVPLTTLGYGTFFLKINYSREFVLICSFLLAVIPGTRTFELLSSKVMTWVGIRCYGIYVLHIPVIIFLRHSLDQAQSFQSLSQTDQFIFLSISSISITLLLAAISYEILERPLIRLGEKYISLREENALKSKVVPKV